MRVLVTGANGFIGSNLCIRLGEGPGIQILPVSRSTSTADFARQINCADFVFHLAGVNRPVIAADFVSGNTDLTRWICETLGRSGRPVPVAFASSTQAEKDNPYGLSKLAAEQVLREYSRLTGAPVFIYRLTNVFGKWCRPNYNSVVATFCYNIARDLPIQINDGAPPLRLTYIDDVVASFLGLLAESPVVEQVSVSPFYETTVRAVAEQLLAFRDSRRDLRMPNVGVGLSRALYSTYVSYLPPEAFAYEVPRYGDERGVFVEMMKTSEAGQFSYFTALPGVTRGSHYHHTKTEKFLVLQGTARFGFRNLLTNDRHSVEVRAEDNQIVETIPGWAHDVTNTGSEKLIVMLWANEVFDRARPDTVIAKVG